MLCAALGFGAGCSGATKPAPADSCTQLAAEVCKQAGTQDPDVCDALQESAKILAPGACAIALQQSAYIATKLTARKLTCTALPIRLCHDIGEKTRACAMVREASRQFTPDRCVAMMSDYPQVLRNLKQQRQQYQLSDEQAAKLTAGDPPAFGPRAAPLQLVEFIDFENRDCVSAAKIVRELKAQYGDRLHMVVRQFPLPYNTHARLAAQAALAAQAQGRFWEFHDALLADQHNLDRASLVARAKQLGLDVKQFDAALQKQQFAGAVDADRKLGEELSVVGMPTMFLNGERMLNAVDKDGIVAAIEERLAGL